MLSLSAAPPPRSTTRSAHDGSFCSLPAITVAPRHSSTAFCSAIAHPPRSAAPPPPAPAPPDPPHGVSGAEADSGAAPPLAPTPTDALYTAPVVARRLPAGTGLGADALRIERSDHANRPSFGPQAAASAAPSSCSGAARSLSDVLVASCEISTVCSPSTRVMWMRVDAEIGACFFCSP